jgi:hypothetical protein
MTSICKILVAVSFVGYSCGEKVSHRATDFVKYKSPPPTLERKATVSAG